MSNIRHGTPRGNHPGGLDEGISLRALVTVLRRRKWLAALVAVMVVTAFAVGAFLLPPSYEAETLLEFEPAFATGHDHGALPHEMTAQHQLPRISEVVYRPSTLETVMKELELEAVEDGEISEPELDAFKSRIGIRVEGERTFAIRFASGDPDRAVRGASRLAELLVQTTRGERENRAEASSEFIQKRIEPLEAELDRQAQAAEDYRERHSDEIPDQVPASLTLLEATQAQLQEVSRTISDDEARRVALQREIAELDRQGVKSNKDPAQARLDQLQAELRQLRRRYTDRHPEVAGVQQQIEDLEAAIARGDTADVGATEPSALQQRYLQLQADLEAVNERLRSARSRRAALLDESGSYQRRVQEAPGHEARLAAMERDYETTREHYLQLLDRFQEAKLAEERGKTAQGSIYRIVEPPRHPSAPDSPNPPRLVLMGLLAGLGLGVGAAFVAEQVDSTFRDVDEVEAALGLPVLASIPRQDGRLDEPAGNGRKSRRNGKNGSEGGVLQEPGPVAAEQYRILATRISRRLSEGAPTSPKGVVLVTGPIGAEGKTTTSVHLASALAQRDEGSVLLVDADVGHPSVHRFLGLPPSNSLLKLLEQTEDDPRLHARWHNGLWLLEAGLQDQRTRPVLSTPRLHRVLHRLRESFGYVVIDGPPILALAEGLVLEQAADTTLLVLRASETPRDAAVRAASNLDPGRAAGVVLNGVDEIGGYTYAYPYHRQESAASAARETRS